MSQVGGRQGLSEIEANQINTPTPFLVEQWGSPMGATRGLFKYKCEKGHVTTKSYPLGTRIDDYDETTCKECLGRGELKTAYIVFAGWTSEHKK